MRKPYLFLDVDGVLNCFVDPEDPFDSDWVTVPSIGNTFQIRIRHRVKRWLVNELPELADVYWNTTWCEEANTCLVPAFGLNRFPVAGGIEILEGEQWKTPWKFEMLLATWQQDPRPFVWVDDEAISETSYRKAHDFSVFGDTPYLLVEPDESCALTDTEIDTINDFLRSHS